MRTVPQLLLLFLPGPGPIHKLQLASRCPSLRRLPRFCTFRIHGSQIGLEGWNALAEALQRNCTVTSLRYSRVHVAIPRSRIVLPPRYLFTRSRHPHICQSLCSLRDCSIGDFGAIALADVLERSSLERLE